MKSIVDKWIHDFADKNRIYVFNQTLISTSSDIKSRAILINTNEVIEVERAFAIGHEIGHIFHNDKVRQGLGGYIMENDADFFAINLIYKHCQSINLHFKDTYDFLIQTGIPTDCFNMAKVAMDSNLGLVMILYSRKPYITWLFKIH